MKALRKACKKRGIGGLSMFSTGLAEDAQEAWASAWLAVNTAVVPFLAFRA
jgi:hypothetical protein